MALYEINNIAAKIDFQGRDLVKRTLQNAKNLLMCRMGEVPYDRFRGFDPALHDLPMTRFREELLPEVDRVMMWEPDAQVVNAEAVSLPTGETYIKLTVDVRITQTGTVEPEEG